MTPSLFANVVILLILIGFSAFFAGAETAFFTLSRSQLAQFKSSSKPLSKLLVSFLAKPKDILVTILVGNEFTNVAISIFVAGIFYELFHHLLSVEALTLLSVAVGTFVILVFGEIVPKSIGMLFAAALAPIIALLLKPLFTLLKPIRYIFVALANFVIRIFGGIKIEETPIDLEEELKELIELGAQSGEVGKEEKELIQKAFAFGKKVVSQIMTSESRVFSLSVDLPYEDLLAQIKATQYSRVPIRDAAKKEIVGILYVKDLFSFDQKWRKDNNLSIQEILRPPLFVDSKSTLENVLEALRQTRIHMAIVTNANKKPIGLVTMHDIVEELFGEVSE